MKEVRRFFALAMVALVFVLGLSLFAVPSVAATVPEMEGRWAISSMYQSPAAMPSLNDAGIVVQNMDYGNKFFRLPRNLIRFLP